MTDRDTVARDMERIFGTRVPDAPPRALDRTRRGSVGIGFAGLVAALGMTVVALSFPPPAPPPSPRVERTTRPVVPIPPVASPRLLAEPPPPALRARRIVRRAPPAPTPSPTLEAPRLTGEALRRALAEDVVLTRRLNREALARDTTSAPPNDQPM